jgi:hypothetical protein
MEKNKANGKHYFNGRYWVYNSIKAFETLFPYLNGEQIRRTIERLKERKALYAGKFNKTGYDRTLWYSVSDEVLELYRGKPDAYIYKKYAEGPRKLPNGKLHLAYTPNANDQTGNTGDKTDKNPLGDGLQEGENPAFGAGSGPEGRDEAAGNDRLGNSIWRVRQIDPAPTPNRFGENAEPIPDINTGSKPAVALPEKNPEKAEGAAARPLFSNITQETIRNTLKRVNGGLAFTAGFYQKAEAHMNREGLDTGYLEFIYRECLARKPENLRGLYYTLIFQEDLTELYKNKTEERRRSLIRCPVCGTEYEEGRVQCPECNFLTDERGDEAGVRFEQRLYRLDDAEKERYTADLLEIFKKYPGAAEARQKHIKGLGKKYQLLE